MAAVSLIRTLDSKESAKSPEASLVHIAEVTRDYVKSLKLISPLRLCESFSFKPASQQFTVYKYESERTLGKIRSQCKKFMKGKNNFPWVTEALRGIRNPSVRRLRAICLAATHYGVGNCEEQSFVALEYVRTHFPSIPCQIVGIFKLNNIRQVIGTHCFIRIGKVSEEQVICDCWESIICKGSEKIALIHVCLGSNNEGKPILQKISPDDVEVVIANWDGEIYKDLRGD